MGMDGTCMRPRQQLASHLGAKQTRVGGDAHTAQVQPIRVPTCKQRLRSGGVSVGMKTASFEQQIESGVIQMNQIASQ